MDDKTLDRAARQLASLDEEERLLAAQTLHAAVVDDAHRQECLKLLAGAVEGEIDFRVLGVLLRGLSYGEFKGKHLSPMEHYRLLTQGRTRPSLLTSVTSRLSKKFTEADGAVIWSEVVNDKNRWKPEVVAAFRLKNRTCLVDQIFPNEPRFASEPEARNFLQPLHLDAPCRVRYRPGAPDLGFVVVS